MLSNIKYLKYLRFVEQLYFKCQEVQDENERHVHRIIKMKKMIKKRRKEVSMLKNRLDRHNDNWRQIPITFRSTKELKRGPKPKTKNFEPKVRRKKQKVDQGSVIV